MLWEQYLTWVQADEVLESLGYDGLIVSPNRVTSPRGRSFVVFDPASVRSASGEPRPRRGRRNHAAIEQRLLALLPDSGLTWWAGSRDWPIVDPVVQVTEETRGVKGLVIQIRGSSPPIRPRPASVVIGSFAARLVKPGIEDKVIARSAEIARNLDADPSASRPRGGWGRYDCMHDWNVARRAGVRRLAHVTEATLEENLRNEGIGRAGYEALLQWAAKYGAALVPARCLGFSTSSDADRAWKALARDFPSSGSVVWMPEAVKKGRERGEAAREPRANKRRGRAALRTTYRVEILHPRDTGDYLGSNKYITRRAEGTLPVATLLGLKGARGEHQDFKRSPRGLRYSENRWRGLVQSIRRDGVKTPILIVVEWTDDLTRAMARALAGEDLQLVEAFVYEGNHRIRAAAEAGLDEVPVEVRWFGLAERDVDFSDQP
jgi:GNAT superfamily N-acetyltransferase